MNRDRARALLAGGWLSTKMQRRAVDLGLLDAADVPAIATELGKETSIKADLKTLLTTLDTLIGATSDPAGTGTLRAIKATPSSTINGSPAPYVKALADALITVARGVKKDIRLDIDALDSTD